MDLGIILLQVPHVLSEPLQDLGVLDVLEGLDAGPVMIVRGDARHDVVEKLVGGVNVLFYQALVDEEVNCAHRDRISVVLREHLLEPVLYRSRLGGICWHVFN